jgi:hypothetical protein
LSNKNQKLNQILKINNINNSNKYLDTKKKNIFEKHIEIGDEYENKEQYAGEEYAQEDGNEEENGESNYKNEEDELNKNE